MVEGFAFLDPVITSSYRGSDLGTSCGNPGLSNFLMLSACFGLDPLCRSTRLRHRRDPNQGPFRVGKDDAGTPYKASVQLVGVTTIAAKA